MAATRDNRFLRPGRSFHSPVSSGWQPQSDKADIELGALLQKRPPSWTYEDDDDQLAASESEAKDRGRRYHARRWADLSSTGASSAFVKPHSRPLDPITASRHRHRWVRSRTLSKILSLIKAALVTLGLLQCVVFICGILEAVFPDELDLVSGPLKDAFLFPNNPAAMWNSDLDILTADVQPFMCHSHNDYWRREPLYSAIHVGCTGVEADVWLFGDELYVAHTASGIRRNRTLEALYLDPLKEILDHRNMVPDLLGPSTLNSSRRIGVFDTKPKQSLVLLVDFKNKPEEVWNRFDTLLAPFRDRRYLTHFDGSDVVSGPLTVVVSGDAPFNRVVENSTYRDIFYDAPLHDLASLPATPPQPSPSAPPDVHVGDTRPLTDMLSPSPTDPSAIYSAYNSYYASTSFRRSIGYPFHSALTQPQLEKIRRQIRSAHAKGLKVRYWGIPAWPIGLRDYLWRVLVREGVDYLSVDDIEDVRWKDWGPRKGGWGKKWWR
ncbi:uncharacterized protein PV07_07629 [Cladophialophora immunda]|uniref:Altered inheritance of mitochondria protein 6 n=1 Tax=Cladophialophora immunda TaxID=569365 RepID=A0A0D2CA49_9EURO|nr:uncharacterized protein PV07_07629 [Cladophialophora immunda]KIW27933.1 hypothetical protein PV07_07629 [Cladophialophora immunda]OQV00958.1 hypothetical protein CLAIMM_06388 [Cladophialophora immunda]